MVQGLWDCQVDVKFGDADADIYKYEPMTALLVRWENIKKEKNVKYCHNQRTVFAVYSLSGRHAGEGNPGYALSIESIHGR